MNIFRIKYFNGFYIVIKESKKKSDKYIFIPKELYCCDNFTFSEVGLKLTPDKEFVLKIILDKKRASKNRAVWDVLDLNKNVCCFINEGFIPYVNDNYLSVRDGNGDLVNSYPIAVFNLDGNLIGFASSKNELLTLWNGDPVNAAVGILVDIGYDFIFKLNKN